jgi:F-type H+-transporting ATPase subunit epsilon
MADQMIFELVSPVKKLLGKNVTMVTMPGTEGDFGVLPGHAPLIATLRSGVIEVYEGDVVSDRLFVASGFAEVTADRCTVLAQDAAPIEDLVRTELEEASKQLNAQLASAEDDMAREKLADQIAVVQAKIEVLSVH